MENETLTKLQRKVEYSRGLRKIKAEAELVKELTRSDNDRALQLGQESVNRARGLLTRARERNSTTTEYEEHLAIGLLALATPLIYQQNFDESLLVLNEAMQLFRKQDLVRDLIKCHELKSQLAHKQDQITEGLAELDQALELGRSANYHDMEPMLHCKRGDFYRFIREFEKSAAAFMQGIDAARKLNDRQAELENLIYLSRMYSEGAAPHKAIDYLHQAYELEMAQNVLGGWPRAKLLGDYAYLSSFLGKTTQAIQLFNSATDVALSAGHHLPASLYQMAQANLHVLAGEYVTALGCLQKADAQFALGNSEDLQTLCLARIGAVYAAAGIPEIAHTYFKKSHARFKDHDKDSAVKQPYIRATLVTLTQNHYTGLPLGEFLKAADALLASVQFDKSSIAYLMFKQLQAHLLDCSGQAAQARDAFLLLSQQFQAHAYPFRECPMLLHLGRQHIDLAEYEAAQECLMRANQQARDMQAEGLLYEITQLLRELNEKAGRPQAAEKLRADATAQAHKLRSTIVNSALQLWYQKSVNRELNSQVENLQTELDQSRKSNSKRERLLESRGARIQHLTDALKQFAAELRSNPEPGNNKLRGRTSKIAEQMQAMTEDGEWQAFGTEVQNQDEEFLTRLARTHPNLTATERRVCALMRLDKTTKELSSLLNITPRSVQAYRHRIRKKLAIPSDADFNATILAMIYPDS